MFFEKLIKYHRVDLFVTYAVDSAFFVADYEITIYLLYLFRYQAELQCANRINFLLIAKGNGVKGKEHLTGLIHWFDIVLKSGRGRNRTEVAVCGDKHSRAAGNCCSADSPDKSVGDICIADPDGVALARHALNVKTNIDIIIARREVEAGHVAQGCIGVASANVSQRTVAYPSVAGAGGVPQKRTRTISDIAFSLCVKEERVNTFGRVEAPG